MDLTCRQLTGAQTISDIDVQVVADLLIPDPKLIKGEKAMQIINTMNWKVDSCFVEFGFSSKQLIRSQKPNPLPGRKTLNDVVFHFLDLTQAERDEVFWAAFELVKNRFKKTKSV